MKIMSTKMNRRHAFASTLACILGRPMLACSASQIQTNLGPGADLKGLPIFSGGQPVETGYLEAPGGQAVDRDPRSNRAETRRFIPISERYTQASPMAFLTRSWPVRQKKVPVRFQYSDESDPGPLPDPSGRPDRRGSGREGRSTRPGHRPGQSQAL